MTRTLGFVVFAALAIWTVSKRARNHPICSLRQTIVLEGSVVVVNVEATTKLVHLLVSHF